jgi:hypothetical protein
MNYAQAVCDALDQLDTTPFGKMELALNKIANSAIKATWEHSRMLAALEKISKIENKDEGADWEEIEEARAIASATIESLKEI